MKGAKNYISENEIITLRKGMKTRYEMYRSRNGIKYPEFDYNTNRVNYTPLRESFEEEFYVVRGIDRTSPNIHIPSTNTLALLFTDDSYIPGKKILNTCQSYAEGKSSISVTSDPSSTIHPQHPVTSKPKWPVVTGLIVLAGLAISFAVIRWFAKPAPEGLVFNRPVPHSIVPQELIVEGKAVNAETVWLVVHYEKSNQYWVQPAVKVQNDGWWIGVVFIGGTGHEDVGLTYQVRAFVNPAEKLISGVLLRKWPEAELASDTLEVVKGPK